MVNRVFVSGLKPPTRSWKPSAWKMGLENDSWALAMAIQRSSGCWQEREFLTLLMQRPVMDARIHSMCSMCLGTSPMVLIGHGSMFFLVFFVPATIMHCQASSKSTNFNGWQWAFLLTQLLEFTFPWQKRQGMTNLPETMSSQDFGKTYHKIVDFSSSISRFFQGGGKPKILRSQ